MNSGVVGAVALLAVGGALYLGSTYLGDYFADRNAATQQAAEESAEPSDALALVPESAETAVEEAAEAMAETAEGAADAVAETADSAVDAVTDLAEGAADAVTETATETADSASEAAGEATEDMAETMADEMTETAMLTEEAAQEVLQNLGSDLPETASEPGTTPVLDVVRVEPSGEVLIAGNAPQGERVGLVYNNEVVAEAEVTEGGDFVLVPEEALPSGEGTLEVVVIDPDGNREAQSDEQVALVLPEEGNEAGFLVGVLRPGEPVEIIEREAPEAEAGATEVASVAEPTSAADETADATPSETETTAEVDTAARAEPEATVETDVVSPFVVVDAIELEGQEIWIAGASIPGTIIRLYQDNELLGETITGEQGRYLFEGTLRDATGDVTVRADALATGSAAVIARAEVPFEMPGIEMAAVAADAASEAAETVAETASAAGEAVADATSGAAESLSETAADVAEAAGDAIAETASEVADAVQSATDSATTAGTTTETAETESATTETETAATAPTTTPASTSETAASEPASNVEVAASTPAATNTERVSVLDTGRVIIRRGDNLWRLSRRVFGQGIRYTSIYDANRDQIRDPALIFPGQVFDLPTPQEEWGEVPGVEALEPDQIPGPDVVQN
ncbi:MAG: LysM peptidoglycan-binding domain-containing protein [Rhizobiales bacterium]|nr:LysM peptidoglycan-binding domain-containing protein [Hyphomicrobiales bacterium]MBO6698705.1 LysM peptidoglycan-binding domain-containing protein [Hyphomicrobiales bacterium]MBO6735042.1 LysM peptidoglycan-binding domain-containing protein [Hyphomicrobiales bacterium]MBO6911152.1 LysM peptidoglycan-binding domain-containing protein [Hyphomicrobiales bacterium]MBO6955662.1 LysM peptidoglycan-binding domain-containing protein [Hyphomicrobiales bacterium]